MKFFYAQNANREIAGVVFEPIGTFGGTMIGIYAAEDENEISALLSISKNPASGVKELTQEDYAKKKLSKTRASRDLKHSNEPASIPVPIVAPTAALAAAGAGVTNAVVVDEPSASVFENPDDVLKIDVVAEVVPEAPVSAPVKPDSIPAPTPAQAAPVPVLKTPVRKSKPTPQSPTN